MANEEAEKLKDLHQHHKKSAAIQTIFTMAFLFTGISNILVSQDIIAQKGLMIGFIVLVDLMLLGLALDIGGGNLVRQLRKNVDGDLE